MANNFLKKIWGEFVYGGHLLSLGASGIILTVMLILNLEVSWLLLAVMYLMPQVIYSFDHLQGAQKDAKTNPQRAQYFQAQKNKIIALIALYIVALLAILFYLKNWQIGLAIAFIVVLGVMYAGVFKNITKKIPAFKNIFVAFIWAFTPTVLVSLYYNLGFSIALLLLFLFIFLRWIVNTSFFDVKDMESDKISRIKTLPVIFGKEKTLNILQIVNALCLLPIIIGVGAGFLPRFSLGLLFFYFYSFYYLEKGRKDKAKVGFLSYVLADGEYILWPIIILLVRW